MNRAERRRWAKQHRGGSHLDCGCTVRYLVPIEPAKCPHCGMPALLPAGGMEWPTAAAVGDVIALECGCAGCGREYSIRCGVEAG